MALGFVIGVTVIGVALFLAFLGVLARYAGLWSWAWNRLMATKEEKIKLCHPEEPVPTGGRPYLLDGDMDWINLWPRSGSYKRFFNLDDVSAEEANMQDPRMMGMDPGIPPQPLRPAPGPPSRFPEVWENAGMDMSRGDAIYRNIPQDSMYPPPLERQDSGRSIGSRTRMRPYKDFGEDSYRQVQTNTSTNPFINNQNYPNYNNPFTYGYQQRMEYMTAEKENLMNGSLANNDYRGRDFLDAHLRNDHKRYPQEQYNTYPSGSNIALDNQRLPNYPTYSPQRVQSSSQAAYDVSLKQALLNQRKREIELQNTLSQQRIIDRYDKMKQDEERIRQEERVLHKLRYENDIIRRSQYENIIKGRSPFELPHMRSYSLEEEKSPHAGRFEFERRYSSEEFSTDEMNSSQDYDRMIFDMRGYRSQASRDSPPPPAPDAVSKLNFIMKEKEKHTSQFTQKDRTEDYGRPYDTYPGQYHLRDIDKHRELLDIPTTPPNTASLTPPEIEFKNSLERHRSSLADPYSNTILKERLAQIEQSRFRESESDNQSPFYGTTELESRKRRSDPVGEDDLNKTLNTIPTNEAIEVTPFLDNKPSSPETEPTRDDSPFIIERKPSGSRKKNKRLSKLKKQETEEVPDIEMEEMIEYPESNSSKRNSLSERYEELSKSYTTGSSKNHITIGSPTKSAFQIVPSSAEKLKNNVSVTMEVVEQEKEPDFQETNNQDTLTAVTATSLGNSPINPRRNFLSYEGSSSWPSATESTEVNQPEEDPNTKRVREYIASLSARLQQLPDGGNENTTEATHTEMNNQNVICTTFPVTPPSSANRTDSQSSTDTCSSVGGTWMPSWKQSTETPPSSAGFCAPTPPNSATPHILNDTPPSSASYFSTPPNSGELNGSFEVEGIQGPISHSHSNMKRAQSCDSVSSESSVTLGDLEDCHGQITGYLSVQVVYESESADLEVLVNQARDLVCPDQNQSASLDSYVRVFLLPDKSTNMQTRIFKNSRCPAYRERFLFALEEEELENRSLVFYSYIADKFTSTLIGESHLKLTEIDLTSNQPIELPLTDYAQKGIGCGEIMFSLSYLPTAERLTVVIVKAKNLQWIGDKTSADPFVKVYILQDGKKIMRKRTNVKKDTASPLFNEAMIFNVPAASLHNIQLRVTVAENVPGEGCPSIPVGHVIVGTQATGKALSHWNQMMASLRKPIGMWHSLRR